MAKEFNSHFLNARITHQECQASLLGNDTDCPFVLKVKNADGTETDTSSIFPR